MHRVNIIKDGKGIGHTWDIIVLFLNGFSFVLDLPAVVFVSGTSSKPFLWSWFILDHHKLFVFVAAIGVKYQLPINLIWVLSTLVARGVAIFAFYFTLFGSWDFR